MLQLWEILEKVYSLFEKPEPILSEEEIAKLKTDYLKLELEIWSTIKDWNERGFMHFKDCKLPPYNESWPFRALLHKTGNICSQLHRNYEKLGRLDEYYAFLEHVRDEQKKFWPQ